MAASIGTQPHSRGLLAGNVTITEMGCTEYSLIFTAWSIRRKTIGIQLIQQVLLSRILSRPCNINFRVAVLEQARRCSPMAVAVIQKEHCLHVLLEVRMAVHSGISSSMTRL